MTTLLRLAPERTLAELDRTLVRAADLADRLGPADLLWSRVSREPEATVAFRPGAPRPPLAHGRAVLAGAWAVPPWPPTMESAVRSGRTAARTLLADQKTTIAAA